MTHLQDRFRLICAVYLIFRDGGKVLLIRRANTGYRDGWYSLPSGHLNGGETAARAAIREAKEEVGVDIDLNALRLAHTMHRFNPDPEPHERIDLAFEVLSWHGDLTNAEPEKCDDISWFSTSKLPENTIPEVRRTLEMIIRDQPYSEFNFQ